MELHLLFSHVATVSSPSSSVEVLKLTPSELPAQEEVWQHLTQSGRAQCISMLDVTTRRPKMYHRVITLTLDITNEIGHRLFDPNSPLFGIIAMQNVGYGWVARHPTLHALNIFWVFDPYASPTASHIRQFNLIFDLDDTLIFNPPLPHPESTPALYYVNQTPPHTICDDPIDTPVKRPHIQDFLALVCDHFKLIKVCTLSLRERARQIIELLDPQHRTLLKDSVHGSQVLVAREDMAEGYSQSARMKIMRGVPPKGFKKNFAVLKMNSVDARATTIVLDDSPGFWSVSAKDNIVPIFTAARTDTLKNPGYLNGYPGDGGVIGRQMLMTLMNLAAKLEGAPHLMQPIDMITIERKKSKAVARNPVGTPGPKRTLVAQPPPITPPAPVREKPAKPAAAAASPVVLRALGPDAPLPNGTASKAAAGPSGPSEWKSSNGHVVMEKTSVSPSTQSTAPSESESSPSASATRTPAIRRAASGPSLRKRPEQEPPIVPVPPAAAGAPTMASKIRSRAVGNGPAVTAASIRATRRVADKPSPLATTFRAPQTKKVRPTGLGTE
eukprot:GGOE01003284.1.p1 GENE.GGOE01003284.1~~GGOE01003284.1.p1  ORF type:complete len:556 (-),score=110.07 GGOE01003284.1:842-2509(-)